jgi:hypothetical protein
MNGIASKIAQKIAVLLENDDVDAGAREQKAKHEPTRPAADDAATGGQLLDYHHFSQLIMPW